MRFQVELEFFLGSSSLSERFAETWQIFFLVLRYVSSWFRLLCVIVVVCECQVEGAKEDLE